MHVIEDYKMFPRIRALREDRDYSQETVSIKLGCGRRAYAHYEAGDRLIPPEILIKLADLYNVSVDYILGRTDKKEIIR